LLSRSSSSSSSLVVTTASTPVSVPLPLPLFDEDTQNRIFEQLQQQKEGLGYLIDTLKSDQKHLAKMHSFLASAR